ncbi:YadA C-terminal domain-containing protein [Neisseriaceae bacterium TC5R-5]|nr:YadA C-terminal domain-containing protein [Neisseriaceae bacterium TC5R-5]
MRQKLIATIISGLLVSNVVWAAEATVTTGTVTVGTATGTVVGGGGGTYTAPTGSGTFSSTVADSLNSSSSTATTIGNGTGTTTINGGAVDVSGATNINNTLDVTGATTVSNTLDVTGATTVNNTLGVTGATTVDNTLRVNSNGGAQVAGSGALNVLNNGNVNLGVASGAATMGGNFSAAANSSAMTVNNGAFGVMATSAANTSAATANTVSMTAGANLASNGNVGSYAPTGFSGGYQAYGYEQTVGAGTSINDTLLNARYLNKIAGNTLIDGDLYINGALNYVSNDSANTTVTDGKTTGATSVVLGNHAGPVVDANGKISTGVTTETTAAVTVTNTAGGMHGLVVQESSTTLSGGTGSTSLTLNDNGARFSNSRDGGAVRVTGIADGSNDYDATNYRQLKRVAAGVAGTAAMANIPQLDQKKKISIGVGLGHFQSQSSLALGATFRVSNNGVVRTSIASQGSNTTVFGVGGGWSW